MPEQEKLEKEALALEALEGISGGLSKTDIKNNVEEGWNKVINYAKENPAKTTAAISLLIAAIAETARGGKDIGDLYNAIWEWNNRRNPNNWARPLKLPKK